MSLFNLQGSLVSCLLSLLQQMEEGHYKHTWEGLNQSMKGHDALRTFLLECFLLFGVLIAGSVFPASWQLMRLKAAQIMLNAMQVIMQKLPNLSVALGNFPTSLYNLFYLLVRNEPNSLLKREVTAETCGLQSEEEEEAAASPINPCNGSP